MPNAFRTPDEFAREQGLKVITAEPTPLSRGEQDRIRRLDATDAGAKGDERWFAGHARPTGEVVTGGSANPSEVERLSHGRMTATTDDNGRITLHETQAV